ncbi:MAG: DUF1385 domain-containing protein [Anaerolineales bacterium]|nr:DUF1385 domain-containing protein [Anaerolineales bacterium]
MAVAKKPSTSRGVQKAKVKRRTQDTDAPKPLYGGQAVIEGVMMRGPRFMAVAMRDPKGKIVLHSEALSPIYTSRWAKVPFLRGLLLLWDALGLGSRVLGLSANVQAETEDKTLEGTPLLLTMLASFGMAIGLFFVLPAGLAHLVERYFTLSPLAGNLLEGVLRLAILLGYLWAVGRMEEIRRVFGYHGAEHKTIHAYEAGLKLTPKTVDKFPLEHPRCGTAFLLTVIVLSILVFTLIGPLPLLLRLLLRVLLIPVLAGVAYEYLRFTAANMRNPLVRVLVAPNLALQRLTTRPPDAKMLEVGIAAFNEMLRLETSKTAKPKALKLKPAKAAKR